MKASTATLLFLLLISSTIYCQNDSLILYYPFSNVDNMFIPDESGNVNNGLGYNIEPAVDRFGHEDNAMFFNGYNSYIEFEGQPFVLDEYSYALWIKVLQNPIYDSAGFIIDVGSAFAVDQFIAYTNSYSNYDLNGLLSQGYHNEGGSAWFTQHDFLEPDTWKFIVMTRSRNYFSVYIDGIMMDSRNISNYTPSYGDTPMGHIGCRNTMHQFFNGYIDDVRIFNYAIDSATIGSLFYTTIVDVNVGDEMTSSKIYPNPVQNTLHLQLPGNAICYTIKLYSSLGNTVAEFENVTEMDLNKLDRGLYFVKIQDITNNKMYTHKLIKE